jgi:hypothetical protein
MPKTSEAPHRGQPGEAPKNETRQKNPTKFNPEGQAHRDRIAAALDRYLRSQKGGRR